jgi:ribosomal protein L40E
MTHPWIIVVTDGQSIRTIHPPALPLHHKGMVDLILATHLVAPTVENRDTVAISPTTKDLHKGGDNAALMTQGEIARTKGFSGSVCQKCGSFNMVRTGTCETCQDCSETSGGCS